ncbi:MAG: hypothetical protein OXU62_07370 [Gammaproteobacteria bacterium]|nr:hypothetical protein [Gammaproteobacteria bacterium]
MLRWVAGRVKFPPAQSAADADAVESAADADVVESAAAEAESIVAAIAIAIAAIVAAAASSPPIRPPRWRLDSARLFFLLYCPNSLSLLFWRFCHE